MKASWWYRTVFFIIVMVVSIVTIIPTFVDFKEDSAYPVKSKISLGLDLQGGLYMILGIDFKKVYKDEIKTAIRKMEFALNDEGIKSKVGELDEADLDDPQHTIIIEDPTQVEKAKEKIREFFTQTTRLTDENGAVLKYGLKTAVKTDVQTQSVTKSIEVIRNRIDEFGVSEPEIFSQGNDRIVVQLPGVKDIDRAKALIGRTAKLTFHLVSDEVAMSNVMDWMEKAKAQGIEYKKGEKFADFALKFNEFAKDKLPKGTEIVFEKTVSKATNEVTNFIPYVLESNPALSGEDLQDANVQIDPQKNEPYVSLNFKSTGAKIFEEVTGKNIGKQLAIVLDGNVYSAPNIQSRIAGGRAQITLGFGDFNKLMAEARDVALILRAGALPVELEFQEQRIVGPSLGADSIARAEIASLVGALLIFAFIMIYYKFSGVIAAFTLVVNVIITLAFLVGLGATLTLPGIAGIALTIGMAVDANIIIYERIREEIRKGSAKFKAVEEGFSQAFWTILDANITTALAGICLLNFGTGPIRGFAVTLLIGILATVYASYFVSAIAFELYMNRSKGKNVSI